MCFCLTLVCPISSVWGTGRLLQIRAIASLSSPTPSAQIHPVSLNPSATLEWLHKTHWKAFPVRRHQHKADLRQSAGDSTTGFCCTDVGFYRNSAIAPPAPKHQDHCYCPDSAQMAQIQLF